MAVTDYDRSTAITLDLVIPKVVDQTKVNSPVISTVFGAMEKKSGGKQLHIPVRYAFSDKIGSYSGLEQADYGLVSTRTRAVFDWKQYRGTLAVDNLELAKNAGEGKVVDLMAEDLKELQESMEDNLATMFYGNGTGNSSKDFLGLIAAADDGTNVDTYGGIVRTSYSWFQSYYNAAAGAQSLSMWATAYDDVASGNDKPDLILTTESVWTGYEALLQPQARYNFAQNGYPKADGGFPSILFRGTDIVSDEKCTSGYAYVLNKKYLHFYWLAHPEYPTGKNGFAVSPLEKPVGQDGRVRTIYLYGEFVTDQPRRLGALRGIS